MFLQYRINRRNQIVLKSLPFPKKGKLLDISFGDGTFLKSLSKAYPDLKLAGIDLITPKALSPNISFEIANAENLPFEDNSFDVIICSMSVHHYKKLILVFKEMQRVLKNDGFIYLIDFLPKNSISQHLYNSWKCSGPYHFEKYYTEHDLQNIISKIGLRFEKIYPLTYFPRSKCIKLLSTL